MKTKDPLGNPTTISYADNFGDGSDPDTGTTGTNGLTYAFATSATNALGHVAKTQYHYSRGVVTGVKDPNGLIAKTEYNDDPYDRPMRVTAGFGLPEATKTEMSYPAPTPPATTTVSKQLDATRWLAYQTTYDGFGRPLIVSESEDGSNFTIFSKRIYDALGRAKFATNPYRASTASADGWTRSTFDLGGRVTEVATFSGGPGTPPPDSGTNGNWTGSVTTIYASEVTTVTDQAGKARRSVTDGLGRLKQVIEDPSALAYSTTYGYDARGNLKTVTQGTQPQRTFSYDLLSRLMSASNPESGPVSYTYDASSNLKTKLDARGITTTHNYDALNRVTSRIYTNDPQNTAAVFYKYDGQTLPAGWPAGFNRGFSTGRLVAATYGTSTSSAGNYTGYDQLGRATSSFQQTDSQNYGFSYGYNLAGMMTSQTYPSGRVVQTEYDAAGRLAGVKNLQPPGSYWAGATPTDAVNRIQYSAHGAVLATKLGNGKWEHTNFNSRLQPLQIGLGTSAINSSLLQLDYGYGTTSNNGNMLSQRIVVVSSPGLDVTQTYGYDTLNRLSSASEGGSWSQTYDMDRHGNRAIRIGSYIPTPALTPQSTNSTDFSAFNQSNNRIALSGFGYDTAGNLTRDPTTAANAMIYDAENKQISYTKAVVTTTYAYDGDGRRVKKADSTGTIVFVYNAGGQLIAEYHSDPVPPPAGGGGTSYLTTDHLGSTRVVTDGHGNVKARHDYLPFGEELGAGIGQRTVAMKYDAPDSTRQKFTQKERDNESGLDYFLARYYSSAQGRFTSADPLLSSGTVESPQTWNRYQYTLNNPLRYIDPTGLFVWSASLGGNVTDDELRRQAGTDRNRLRDANRTIDHRNRFRTARTAGEGARDALPAGAERDSVTASLASYGAEGVENGVSVGVGNVAGGAAAETTTTFSFDTGTNTFRSAATVTIDDDTRGNNLTAAVAHEGRHVGDAQEFAAAATADVAHQGFAAIAGAVNRTRYQREVRAYIVSSLVAQGLGLENSEVGGNRIWDRGWAAADRARLRSAGINNHLRTSSTYRLTPQNPGNRYIPFEWRGIRR